MKQLPKELQPKVIKVPLWARCLGEVKAWNRARLRRKQYRANMRKPKLVTTITVWLSHEARGDHPAWIHCYENGYGVRSYIYKHGFLSFPEGAVLELHRIVMPWSLGKYTNEQLINYAQSSHRKPSKSE